MAQGIGKPPIVDHSYDKHYTMKDGAKYYGPVDDSKYQQKPNMSAEKPILGAPGSDVMSTKRYNNNMKSSHGTHKDNMMGAKKDYMEGTHKDYKKGTHKNNMMGTHDGGGGGY